jgi:7,8-dihydropterin-6-yl-methyl-4-(beta-D-ribofuranosyl)aminobenzene 5'-phosphate synthase
MDSTATVTILYDNRPSASRMTPGWGFAALIEVADERLLFDAGADMLIFEENATIAGVDLHSIDHVFLSHAHSDHIGGLGSVLHTGLNVYIPEQGIPRLKDELRGEIEPSAIRLHAISEPSELLPGILTTGSMDGSVTEHAAMIRTSSGLLLLTGCAHPGIMNVVRTAVEVTGDVPSIVMGGFHLFREPDSGVSSIAHNLKETGVQQLAPCHCTGLDAIGILHREFGSNAIDTRLGTRLVL